jgi:hypothetical protein
MVDIQSTRYLFYRHAVSYAARLARMLLLTFVQVSKHVLGCRHEQRHSPAGLA